MSRGRSRRRGVARGRDDAAACRLKLRAAGRVEIHSPRDGSGYQISHTVVAFLVAGSSNLLNGLHPSKSPGSSFFYLNRWCCIFS